MWRVYSCENKQLYADTIRHLRMSELRCVTRVRALQAGISSVLPLQLFSLMTPADAQLRTCGLPTIDLNFLKVCQRLNLGVRGSNKSRMTLVVCHSRFV